MSVKSYVQSKLDARNERKQRKTWTVSTQSRHFRLYQMWRDFGGANPKGYRENFCHYWRVVVLWAPLRWFLYKTFFDMEVVRPASITGAALVALAATVMAIIWPMGFLTLIFYTFLLSLGMATLFGLLYLGETYSDEIGDFLAKIFRPIGKVLKPIFRPVVAAFDWFFLSTPVWKVVTPWSVVVAIAVVTAFILFPGPMFIITGVLIGGGLAWAAIALTAEAISDWYYSHRRRKAQRPDGIVRLTGLYMVSKKHGICPYVEFDKPLSYSDLSPQTENA